MGMGIFAIPSWDEVEEERFLEKYDF